VTPLHVTLALAVVPLTLAWPTVAMPNLLGFAGTLTDTPPNIQPAQLGRYFKDATFGVRAGGVESTTTPEAGVTIVRDTAHGVPHIYGDTRPELMFGIGYATAQDRLFFIDALRHAGRGELAQFAGGANVAMDESVWRNEPYTEQDRTNQVQFIRTHVPDGQQIFDDAQSYVAGINAYIGQAKLDPLMMPAEYDALGMGQGPQPFRVEDLVSVASLVGGIFGVGGGAQLSNALLYQGLRQRFGPERAALGGSPEAPAPAPRRRRRTRRPQARRPAHRAPAHRAPVEGGPADAARASGPPPAGVARSHRISRPRHHLKRRRPSRARPVDTLGFATLLSFVDPSDPEAPTTVRGRSFPYQTLPAPGRATRATIARAGGERGSRPAELPPRDVQCPAGLRPPQRQRSPAGGDGPAGLLLHPPDPDGGGHPRAGHRRRRRRLPGGQPLRRARTQSRLRVVGYLLGAEHRRHVRGAAVQPHRRPRLDAVGFYLLHGSCVPMETLTRIESW